MQVIGIVAEYNPFHHGHRYQIAAVRQRYPAAHVVAVMSGSFTQRGAPSILDKWTRAAHAVEGGADLILELPFAFACRSAQDFARGSISLLSHLGIVTHLAFGMEAEELLSLAETAAMIDSDPIQIRLHEKLGEGLSYAAALTYVLMDCADVSEEVLRAPNNILAIEYLRALRTLAPQITPIAIQRTAVRHNDIRLHTGVTSSSSIRTSLNKTVPPWDELQQSVMPSVLDDLQRTHHAGVPSLDTLLELLRYLLLMTDFSILSEIYGITEGIENRLIRSLESARNYEEFLLKVSTKRYAQSRIARLMIYLLLHLKKIQAARFDAEGASYIRPLAFNPQGRKLLRAIKGDTTLPIITRVAEFLSSDTRRDTAPLSPLQQMLSFDTRATELRLLTRGRAADDRRRTDFITSPTYIP